MTRRVYVHEATLGADPGSELGAIGAAVTAELCGRWEHEPPCRWPHNNAAVELEGGRVAFRTVFVAEPTDEGEVRSGIERGLRRGRLAAPEGSARWQTLASGRREPTDDEARLGARLAG